MLNNGERERRLQPGAAAFSPLELNSLYEGLQRLIAFRQPPKIEVLLCVRFLEALIAQGPGVWSAFGWEVAGHMARRLPGISLWGLSPAEVGVIEAILLHAVRSGSIAGQDQRSTGENLRAALGSLQAHRKMLDDLLRAAPGSVSSGMSAEPPGESSILVPVIEKLNAAGHAPDFFSDVQKGSVVRLHVVVSDRSASTERRRLLRGGTRGEQNRREDLRLFGPVPARAAGRLVEAAGHLDSLGGWAVPAGRPRLDDCVLSVRFTPEEARLDGDSAGLAFVLAAAVARASLAPGRRSVQLAGGLAATGVLDGTGVAPVEPGTLDSKVEAAFFSSVRLLLVPAAQEAAANDCLDRLFASHPDRDLTIRGVYDASRVFAHGVRARGGGGSSRVATVDALVARSRSAVDTVASLVRWLGRSRWRTAAVLTAALAAMSLIGWEIHRHWPIPAEVAWVDDAGLEIRNRYDVVISEFSLPHRPPNTAPCYRRGCLFGLVDFAGNGRRQAVVLHGSIRDRQDLLSVVDRRGRVVWRVDARSPRAGWHDHLRDHIWYPFLPLSDGDRQRLFLASRSPQGGWIVCYIGQRGGGSTYSLAGALANPGHMDGFYSWDVTGDGVEEVFACGVHNRALPDATPGSESRGRGLAVLLDPVVMSSRALCDSFDSVPLMTTPQALDAGVLAAYSFPQDRFSNLDKLHIARVESAGAEQIRAHASMAGIGDGALGCVLFTLTGPDPLRPYEVHVLYADSYRHWIQREYPEMDTDGAIAREAARLRAGVMMLTPDGWKPVVGPPALEPDESPAELAGRQALESPERALR